MTRAEHRSVDVYGRVIEFQLKRAKRRTLSISVEPDRRVVVTAPIDAATELVDARVLRRAQWIRRQQKYFDALPPPMPPRRWISGETHRYLGRQYRLRVISEPKSGVRLVDKCFIVSVQDIDDASSIEREMNDWYEARAKEFLPECVARLLESTTWVCPTTAPQIIVRRMRRRWGSTTRAGRIYLNVDLVKMPKGCIDYVLAHELAHLTHPNHSPAFWRLVIRLCPEWQKWRDRLGQQQV